MSTKIPSLLEAKSIAELLVGENVKPVGIWISNNGTIKTREYDEDRFAQDDDGYYLVNSKIRIPLNAIDGTYDYGDGAISLELDNEYLERRVLLLR